MDKNDPLDDFVGHFETGIGIMLLIMPIEEQKKNLQQVYAEPYNRLILGKKAFKYPIPEVKGLASKGNTKGWFENKSHIHNFGHTTATFSGFLFDPSVQYLTDILKFSSIKTFNRSALLQRANVLMRKYSEEFTLAKLTDHIDDLLNRFKNCVLGNTFFKVDCDLKRILNGNKRILSSLIYGIQTKAPINKILLTFAYGLCFKAKDERGNLFQDDEEILEAIHEKALLLYYTILTNCLH